MRPRKVVFVKDGHSSTGSDLRFALEQWGYDARRIDKAGELCPDLNATLVMRSDGRALLAPYVHRAAKCGYRSVVILAVEEREAGYADLANYRVVNGPGAMIALRENVRIAAMQKRGPKRAGRSREQKRQGVAA